MRELIAKRFQRQPEDFTGAAAQINADDIINLSIGDTDFVTDERITKAAMTDALAGYTHYAPPQGDPELIAEIQKFYATEYALQIPKEEIFITTSSCFGMALALMSILDPLDEVLVFAPYFWPYRDQIMLAGGKAVEVPTEEANGFCISKAALKAAITPKTKAFIVNNPCNPTGAAYDAAACQMLAEVAEENDLLILADDIYTDYMYQKPFVPLRSLPGMEKRVITLNSFSKNYIMTGWRIGSIIAPKELVRVMQGINENLIYSAPYPSQRAALAALRLRSEIGDRYTGVYRERVFFAAERIRRIDKLSVRDPEGTFYLFINIKKTGLTSASFCDKVLKEAHVAMVPGSAFGAAGEGYVRIACTVSKEALAEAFDRIAKLKF